MICPSCQHENDAGNEVCFACGARLASATSVTRGSVIAGRYEIQTQLGRGGMGVVYKARDRVLDEDVVIKLLRPDVAQEPEMARRFRSEIKLARRVTHKNVCRIHEYGQDGALRYISMELIEGQDLRKLVRSRPLAPHEAFDISLQIAAGLDAIHEVGIIHRDLKTPNIMLDTHGIVKLMDFGIAKSTKAETTLGATATGQIVGTPEYMSPEQAQGGPIDVRSDVYGLGIVIFEVFTGQVPFRGDTPLSTILKHIHEPVPLDGEAAERLPLALIPVLRKALAKSPDDRYAHAGDTLLALKSAREAFLSASTPAATERARRQPGADATVQLGATVRRAVEPAPSQETRAAGRPGRARWLWLAPVVLGCAAGLGYLALRGARPRGDLPTAPSPSAPPVTGSPEAPPPALPASPEAEPVAARAESAGLASPPAEPQNPRRDRPVRDRPASRPAPTPAREAPRPTPALPPVVAAATPNPPAPPSAAVSEERGFLQVTVVPGAELVVDGGSLGSVTSRKISLAPGAHAIRLVHPEYQPVQRKVTILPGETARVIVDLAEEAIRKKK